MQGYTYLTDDDILWIKENIHAPLYKNDCRVTLSPQEIAIVRYIAQKRYEAARSAGVKDQRLDTSSTVLDIEGFGAEMAFCKKFNFYPDFTVGARSGGFDVLTRKGAKVDIKYTQYQTGHLLATLKKKGTDTDIYVLVIGKLPNYTIVGYMAAEDLFKDENLKDMGHGVGYVASQEQLKPMV